MGNIEIGFLLMVVGMTTVFAILLIIINLGKGLIFLVNKYAPEEISVKKQVLPQTPTTVPTASSSNITAQTTAAIVSAVSVTTRGQGKVVKIEKL